MADIRRRVRPAQLPRGHRPPLPSREPQVLPVQGPGAEGAADLQEHVCLQHWAAQVQLSRKFV